jgi:hypothetical protein
LKQAKPLGLKAKFACYYLNDDNAITAVANDDAVIGSAGAEVYMLTIPARPTRNLSKASRSPGDTTRPGCGAKRIWRR